MKKIILSFICFVLMSAPVVHAADVDYSRVINLSGKQRMLTQKMSKEAMLVALGVDTQSNLGQLQKTRDLFDKTLIGLRNGDESLGLPKTKKPKILKGLDKVDGLWADFDGVISGVVSAGSVSDSDMAAIAGQNIPLLKAMNKTVKMYEAAASGGEINPALAVAINLAGRQRMLTQKMSKEFFMVAKGHDVDATKENLAQTVNLFDSTLNGLINGDDSLGLSPAPTDEIMAQLEKVKSMWAPFKTALESEPTADSIKAISDQNIPLLKEMNKAVGMFASLAKG